MVYGISYSRNWTTKQITVSNAAVNESVVFTKNTVKYKVSVDILDNADTGGRVLGSGSYEIGKKVTMTVRVSHAASFWWWINENGIKIYPNETPTELTYSFIMPARDVVITAQFGNPV